MENRLQAEIRIVLQFRLGMEDSRRQGGTLFHRLEAHPLLIQIIARRNVPGGPYFIANDIDMKLKCLIDRQEFRCRVTEAGKGNGQGLHTHESGETEDQNPNPCHRLILCSKW